MSEFLNDELDPEELLALQAAQGGEELPAEPPTLPQAAPVAQRAPAVVPPPQAPSAAPAAPPTDDDILRQGLLKQVATAKQQRDELSQAENRASQNTGFARIAQAGANLGASLAGSAPINQQPFEDLAADAQAPLKAMERRSTIATNQDKILRDYLVKQAIIKGAGDRTDKRIAGAAATTDKKIATTVSEGDKNRKSREGIAKDRNAFLGQSLGLRMGNQAMKVAKEFKDDKVMMATSQQQQMIAKALGQLDEVKAGRIPFTSQLKADIETDLAKAFGQGNSLGATERTEFMPYQASWANLQSKIQGIPLDLGLDGYRKQLENQLNVFAGDLEKIQNARKSTIGKGYETAVSGNPLAAKTLKENAAPTNSAQPAPGAVPPGKVRVKNLDTGKTGFLDEGKLDAALKSKKFERVQ